MVAQQQHQLLLQAISLTKKHQFSSQTSYKHDSTKTSPSFNGMAETLG